MTTAVIGATGRVGSVVVRELLARNRPVLAIVRAPAKARQLFGQPEGLEVRQAELDGLAGVRAALRGAGTVFIAMGASGLEGNLQRFVIQAAASTPVEQVVRLAVLNTSPTSLGINQRAHWNIDFAARVAGVPYSTIRPAIFSASLLAAAAEVRASRTWTGLAGTGQAADRLPGRGRGGRARHHRPGDLGNALRPQRPAAVSWPEAMRVLSGELGKESPSSLPPSVSSSPG